MNWKDILQFMMDTLKYLLIVMSTLGISWSIIDYFRKGEKIEVRQMLWYLTIMIITSSTNITVL